MKRSTTMQMILGVVVAFATLGSANVRDCLDPRGPVQNVDMKVVASADGVQAIGYKFSNACAKPTPWQAQWIWVKGATAKQPVGCFRKEVDLTELPQQVSAWMTADIKYRLYINGKLVARGPVDMGTDYVNGDTHQWFYDFRDLTPFFVNGKNVIAAEVFTSWPVWKTVSRGSPGFLFEAAVKLKSGSAITVKSDESWRSRVAPYFPTVQTYDAQEEPTGWRFADFNDSAWNMSDVAQDRWSPLIPSQIPPLMEIRYPCTHIEGLDNKVISKDTHFRVVCDRVLSGYPTLKFRGGKGTVVTIKAHYQAQVILGEGETYFEFPYMTEIAPDYSVELNNVTAPLEVIDAGAVFTSQPLEYRGAFACSDDKLNQIWEASRWAVQICLQTHHLDSPNHQEPLSDPGDYVIESMVNDYAFAQPWLTRQDIRKFAWLLKDENYRNFHTSYSLAWLQMLMDYYDFTGDQTLMKEMAPYVHDLLETYTGWIGKTGIISEAPNYMFMDWVNIGGFEVHHPPAVIGQGYLTALYYHGLTMAAAVAQLDGDFASVERYRILREKVATSFNRELWVNEKGLYRDGKPFQTSVPPNTWLPADKNIETFSPHVNVLAVLYDLAPKEQQTSIMERLLNGPELNTQPWFMHWVFQAIDHAGLFDKFGTAQLRRWKINLNTKTFLEMWNQGDLSHGWCSTPLVQMSSRILGVTPQTPGYKTISIRPELCDLTWAKGKVPTPLGDVSVSWTCNAESLNLTVIVSHGSHADIQIPTERFPHPLITKEGEPSNSLTSRRGYLPHCHYRPKKSMK